MLHQEITGTAIKAFYTVHTEMGWGFLESVYQNAMLIELKQLGLKAEKERNVKVNYKGKQVGDYFADIIIEDKVILELKTHERLDDQCKYQLINYLKASNIEIGLLLNFGKSAEFKRVIHSNDQNRQSPIHPTVK